MKKGSKFKINQKIIFNQKNRMGKILYLTIKRHTYNIIFILSVDKSSEFGSDVRRKNELRIKYEDAMKWSFRELAASNRPIVHKYKYIKFV